MGSRGNAGGGGRSVGVATGVIRISTGQLVTDANRANQVFKDLSKAGMQIGAGVQAGTKQAETSLKSLQSTANNVFATLARGFALPGLIGATQSVKQLEFTIRQLAGSEDKANQQFEIMDRLAKRTGQSVLTIQKAAVGILPAVNRANVDLEQTLLLAQRLAVFDPAQGAAGAGFALREFMSGSVVSLATRFELPRQELNRILQESQGNTQAMIDGLDALIAKMGVTEETIIAAGEQGINTFTKLRDEVTLTAAQGFEPFLNNAILPLVEGFNDLMSSARDSNAELLEVAGTLAGILATVTALQAVGLGGRGVTGVAALGAAGFIGVEGGTAAARFLSERGAALPGIGPNRRLQNVSQDEARQVIEETFKQAIVLAADGLIQLYGILRTGTEVIENATDRAGLTIELLSEGLELGYTILKTGFENLVTIIENAGDKTGAALELMALDFVDAFAQAIASLGELLIELPLGGAVDRRGRELIQSAEGDRDARNDRRRQLEEAARKDLDEGTTEIGKAIEDVAKRIDETIQAINEASLGLDSEQAQAIADEIDGLRQHLPELAKALGLLDEESERVKNVWAGGILQRDQGDDGGPEFTDEMLETFRKFQEDITELNKKAADDRKKAEADAAKQRTEATTKYNKDLNETIQDTDKKRVEIQKDANTETIQAEQDHQDRLADIRRNASRDIERAAARFDQAGVFNAQQRERDAIEDEKRQHEKQRSRRQESIAEELIDLETAKQERLNELRVGYQEELAAIAQQRNERLNQINATLREELAARNAAFAQVHNRLVAEAQAQGNHNVRMLTIQQQGTAALEAQYRAWITRMGGYAPQATPQQFQQAAQNVQAPIKNIKIPGFASGTGNTGAGGLAMLHPGEIVGNATTAAMMHSMTGSQNPTQAQMQQVIAGGGKSLAVSGNTFLFGDIGGYSEQQVEAMVFRGMQQYMEAMAS